MARTFGVQVLVGATYIGSLIALLILIAFVLGTRNGAECNIWLAIRWGTGATIPIYVIAAIITHYKYRDPWESTALITMMVMAFFLFVGGFFALAGPTLMGAACVN